MHSVLQEVLIKLLPLETSRFALELSHRQRLQVQTHVKLQFAQMNSVRVVVVRQFRYRNRYHAILTRYL